MPVCARCQKAGHGDQCRYVPYDEDDEGGSGYGQYSVNTSPARTDGTSGLSHAGDHGQVAGSMSSIRAIPTNVTHYSRPWINAAAETEQGQNNDKLTEDPRWDHSAPTKH